MFIFLSVLIQSTLVGMPKPKSISCPSSVPISLHLARRQLCEHAPLMPFIPVNCLKSCHSTIPGRYIHVCCKRYRSYLCASSHPFSYSYLQSCLRSHALNRCSMYKHPLSLRWTSYISDSVPTSYNPVVLACLNLGPQRFQPRCWGMFDISCTLFLSHCTVSGHCL
jgi:hypothetical protein